MERFQAIRTLPADAQQVIFSIQMVIAMGEMWPIQVELDRANQVTNASAASQGTGRASEERLQSCRGPSATGR